MCGLLGAVGAELCPQRFAAALALLAHRGPDASGTWERPEQGVLLGHRRLAILDLTAAANQPFVKGDLVLLYNGEIYNFRELRSLLARAGAEFRTQSDTEVVLEACRHWGVTAALERLRGMFAFALYDVRDGSVHLARDPFGMKPLYWHQDSRGGFFFASELKALLPVLDARPPVNESAIAASLLYQWLPESQDLYRGVHRVAAGAWLHRSSTGTLSHGKFFEHGSRWGGPAAPGRETAERLRQLVDETVRLHLVSDVPVATFLSGGLDSTLLTALTVRHTGQVDSYCIAFQSDDRRFEAMPDDLKYARRFAAATPGVRLHEIEVGANLADHLPRLVEVLDEPIGDPAAINTLLICDGARAAGTKVLLSGTGADELFGGYRRHLACLLAARFKSLPASIRSSLRAVGGHLPVSSPSRGLRWSRWLKRFLSFAELPEEAAYRRSYTYYGAEELLAVMGERFRPAVAELCDEHAALWAEASASDHVNRMGYVDMRLFLNGLNLTYTDRASMAASTEVRLPFVDVELARLAFSIPGNRKIRGLRQKWILKQAAAGWVPEAILRRPKSSFGLPLRAWTKGPLRAWLGDMLPTGEIVSGGWLRADAVRRMLEDEFRGRRDLALPLWQLATLELWLRMDRRRRSAAA